MSAKNTLKQRSRRRSKKRKCKSQRRRVKIFKNGKAAKEGISPLVEKYWFQRYCLFSKYDEGIKMDEEGWFSVTPEEIAIRHAERCTDKVVIDSFSGVGGNAIQFAKKCCHVIAIDIDPEKVALAMNNAKGDIVFLSPPWGGPSYKNIQTFTLDLLKPRDGYTMFQIAQAITPNIIMFLPRNVDPNQVEELSWLSSPPLDLEIEPNYVHNNLKGVTVYFGGIVAAPHPRSMFDCNLYRKEIIKLHC
ncbi:trimethylguanosine synthase-like [Senna tora]|uniref:Trimethylguanosine synthase n=1 Tax=Senna tora TaxID=362788 RepID=A0A834W9T8_9FABA|nr:trimethylguanosine synthase-like [Senna tora]